MNKSIDPGCGLSTAGSKKCTASMTLQLPVSLADEWMPRRVRSKPRMLHTAPLAISLSECSTSCSAQWLAVLDNERSRIASDLHDSVGQSLCCIKMRLGRAQEGADNVDAQSNISQAVIELGDAIDEMRRIVEDLRPPALDHLELSQALAWHCRKVGKVHPDTLIIEDLDTLAYQPSVAVSVAAYRIFQEALHNALQHSGAQELRVTLRGQGLGLVLSVQDNGCGGVCRDSGAARGGYGLRSMMARAEGSAGRFSLESNAQEGTCVSVFWPDAAEVLTD